MNTDKKHASRGLGGARRTTAMPVDEVSPGAASPQPAVIVPPGPEGPPADTATFPGRGQASQPELADACTAVGGLGALLRNEGLLRLEPHGVAPPTHGGALGLDAPEARPKGFGPTSAAGGE